MCSSSSDPEEMTPSVKGEPRATAPSPWVRVRDRAKEEAPLFVRRGRNRARREGMERGEGVLGRAYIDLLH